MAYAILCSRLVPGVRPELMPQSCVRLILPRAEE
jgi:hypothetical protein